MDHQARSAPLPAVPERDPQPPAVCPAPAAGLTPADLLPSATDTLDRLHHYFVKEGNPLEDIRRFQELLSRPRVILEIGCGGGEAAWKIARRNPDLSVIGTDLYDWTVPEGACSHYRKVALAWRDRRLPVQQALPPNLVLLKAEAGLLTLLPDRSIESLLVVHAEPAVGRALMAFIRDHSLHSRFKTGDRAIVILPYCREMGVGSCGGYEFEHGADWSRGLGYLMESAFSFRKGDPVQWGVDLRGASPYARNSTQSDVWVWCYREPFTPRSGPDPQPRRRLSMGGLAFRSKPRP